MTSVEGVPELDLVAVYGDQIITIGGLTGSIRDLADMCPKKPLDNPVISRTVLNEWVAKKANENGLEVEPQHADYIQDVAARQGREVKFTVAPVSAEPKLLEKPLTGLVQPTPKPLGKVTVAAVVERQLLITVDPVHVRATGPATLLVDKPVRVVEVIAEVAPVPAKIVEALLVEVPLLPVVQPKTLTRSVAQVPTTVIEYKPVVEVENILTTEPSASSGYEPVTVAEPIVWLAEPPAMSETGSDPIEPLYINELPAPSEILDSSDDIELDVNPIPSHEVQPSESKHREQYIEPVVLVMEALVAVVRQEWPGLVSDTTTHETIAEVPPIVPIVYQRVQAMTPAEQLVAAPYFTAVIETVQLMNDEPSPEMLIVLEQAVEELYEALGIVYQAEDIKQCIAILLRPEAQAVLAETLMPADLEREGTREAKRRFGSHMLAGIDDIKRTADRLLGRFALATSARYERAA